MRHTTAVCLCTLVAAGCNAPAGPTFIRPPAPVPTATPTPVSDITVTGRVLDDLNRTVADAQIRVRDESGRPVTAPPISSTREGVFEFRVAGWVRDAGLSIEKQGFETTYMAVSWPETQAGQTAVIDLRLHAVVQIRAGETARIAILDRRVRCSLDSESLPACRTVRISSGRAGRLVIETRESFMLELGGLTSRQHRVDLTAPGEIEVNVAALDAPPQEALVVTRLEAQ